MRFDQARAAGAHAARAYVPIEYPKYVSVDGKPVMALDADHEAELLGASTEQEGADPSMENMLSAPAKRGPGRPKLVRDTEQTP